MRNSMSNILRSRILLLSIIAVITLVGLSFYISKLYQYINKLERVNTASVEKIAKVRQMREISDRFKASPSKCDIKLPGNVWLVSYANKGVYFSNQNGQIDSAINRCVDFYRPIDPRIFLKITLKLIKKYFLTQGALVTGCGSLILFLKP